MKGKLQNRITAIVASVISAGMTYLAGSQKPTLSPAPPIRPVKRIGTTYSITHARWRRGEFGGQGAGPDWQVGLKRLPKGISVVRLSLEWDEIEKAPGQYDWELVDQAVKICGQMGVRLIICVGVKTPRYPEVHLPSFYRDRALGRSPEVGPTELNLPAIREELLAFIEAIVRHYRDEKRVEGFQIENEPLEPFGDPGLSVPFSFLREEVELVRSLTKGTGKTLAVTMGAGLTEPYDRMARDYQAYLEQLLSLDVDRIGLDLYQHGYVGMGPSWFRWTKEFWASEWHWVLLRRFVEQIKAAGKTPYVAECQAEPWEVDPAAVNFTDPNGNRSLTPESYKEIFARASGLGCDDLFIWGWEFQAACENVGNRSWREATETIIRQALPAAD